MAKQNKKVLKQNALPGEKTPRSIRVLVVDFCNCILKEADCLNETDMEYIETLSDEEKSTLNTHSDIKYKSQIREIVQEQLLLYISRYRGKNTAAPFEFDSADHFQKYREAFVECYKSCSNHANMPEVFNYAFDCIKQVSEQYRFFEYFYEIRKTDFEQVLASAINTCVSTTIPAAVNSEIETKMKDAVKSATLKAELHAENAAKTAKEAVNQAVDKKMNDVTKTISETSVTILGIFAGIVLTVVAGLFYSSSVINNINSANIHKLICVSALVGFVGMNLIAIMFDYINKIRLKESVSVSQNLKNHYSIILIDVILLAIMIISGIIFFKEDTVLPQDVVPTQQYEVNISLDDETQNQSNDQIESPTPSHEPTSTMAPSDIPGSQPLDLKDIT